MRQEYTKLPEPKRFQGMSQYRPPLCFELVGKRFELVMDSGYDHELQFTDRRTLRWGLLGGEDSEYRYDCLKGDDDTYLVNFELTGAARTSCMTLVLDLEQSLVTSCYCTIGENPRYPTLPKPYIVFGAIRREDGTLPELRHGYTEDMVGRAICWNYGTLVAGHAYVSEHYYRITLPPDLLEKFRIELPELYVNLARPGCTALKDEPCSMIKIKDGLYVLDMNEEMMVRESGHGGNLFFLMNLDRMTDVGRAFGCNEAGETENYTYGAYGYYFDAAEVLTMESTALIR